MRKLTIDDILEQRAYERERDQFRRYIIDLKRARRVALGPIMTIVFETTDTMRWQVQEMARAERMMRDEQIAHEVETYNQIIPDTGELSLADIVNSLGILTILVTIVVSTLSLFLYEKYEERDLSRRVDMMAFNVVLCGFLGANLAALLATL